jgi:hypothetical protein
MRLVHAIPILGLLAGLLLAGCSPAAAPASAPRPTDTPLPTATATPTITPTATVTPTATPEPTTTPTLVATATPEPTSTPAPTATAANTGEKTGIMEPTGKPLVQWNAIPLMPGALHGDDQATPDSQSYTYSIKSSPDKVKAYYDRVLANLGWKPMANGTGSTGAIMLIYTKGSNVITVSILKAPSLEGIVLVLLLKV